MNKQNFRNVYQDSQSKRCIRRIVSLPAIVVSILTDVPSGCLLRFGSVWFGLVWFGLVWFGLVWGRFHGSFVQVAVAVGFQSRGVGDAIEAV